METSEIIDLFEKWETLPAEIQAIISELGDNSFSYAEYQVYLAKFEALGYTCSYGSSGEIFGLKEYK